MELSICGDMINREEKFPNTPGIGDDHVESIAPLKSLSLPLEEEGMVTAATDNSSSLAVVVDTTPFLEKSDDVSVRRNGRLSDEKEPTRITIASMDRMYEFSTVGIQGKNPTLEVVYWVRRSCNLWWSHRQNWSRYQWFSYYLPLVGVLRTYRVKDWLLRDVLAGLGVAAMLVPQGMSYARLAGLPNVYGLFGSFIPLLMYGIFGTSRQLAVGPVAVTSLMIGSGLPDIIGFTAEADPNKPLNAAAQQTYNIAAVQVAFIAGIMYTSVGVFNLGFVINLLSHSVLAGFMTGASLIIGLSQMKYLMGYSTRMNLDNSTMPAIPFPKHDPVHLQLMDLLSPTWLPYFKWREFLMGASWVAMLFGIKKLSQWKRPNGKAPLSLLRAFGPVTIVFISTMMVGLGHLDEAPHGVKIVGTIPTGLPKPMPISTFFNIDRLGAKVTLAMMICLVDVIESMSIARALAMSHNYEIDPTRELRGLGIANIVGSLFGCYTTTGSFSRSAVNNECGACSQLAGLITGFTVMVVLLWLTPIFAKMPTNAMGACVIFAVTGLFKMEEFFFLWKVNKFDWFVFTLAAGTVMFYGVEIGLAISITVSIAIVLFKSAFPRVSLLGRLPGTTVYRNAKQYTEAVLPNTGLVVRIDAPLFFGNVTPVREAVAELEREHIACGKPLRWLVLDCSPMSDVDASAMHFLKDWVKEHRQRHVQMAFCNVTEIAMHMIEQAGVADVLGSEWIHLRVHDGVMHCVKALPPQLMTVPTTTTTTTIAATTDDDDDEISEEIAAKIETAASTVLMSPEREEILSYV